MMCNQFVEENWMKNIFWKQKRNKKDSKIKISDLEKNFLQKEGILKTIEKSTHYLFQTTQFQQSDFFLQCPVLGMLIKWSFQYEFKN